MGSNWPALVSRCSGWPNSGMVSNRLENLGGALSAAQPSLVNPGIKADRVPVYLSCTSVPWEAAVAAFSRLCRISNLHRSKGWDGFESHPGHQLKLFIIS